MTSIKKTLQSILLILGMIMMTTLLSACESLLKPKHLTIEYDEKVKLHDGEMMWVHITRHYLEGGKEIPEMFRGGGKNVIPTKVEISWDTGFDGVGRKSVYFKERIAFIDKYDDVWYLVGTKNYFDKPIENSSALNCTKIGVLTNSNHDCLVTINSNGKRIENPIQDLWSVKMNILYTVGLKGSGSFPKFLNNQKLSWSQKLELQETQPELQQSVNKPYSYDRIKR